MKKLRAITAACLLATLAGCVTPSSPADPSVYQPSNRIAYPQPR